MHPHTTEPINLSGMGKRGNNIYRKEEGKKMERMDGKVQVWKRSKDNKARKGGKGYMMLLKLLIGNTLGQRQYGLADCWLFVGCVTLAQCYRANVGPITTRTHHEMR